MVFVMGEGLPDGEGEGEDEVVVFGLGAVAAEVDEFVDEVRHAGGAGRERQLAGGQGGAQAG